MSLLPSILHLVVSLVVLRLTSDESFWTSHFVITPLLTSCVSHSLLLTSFLENVLFTSGQTSFHDCEVEHIIIHVSHHLLLGGILFCTDDIHVFRIDTFHRGVVRVCFHLYVSYFSHDSRNLLTSGVS